MRTTSLSSPGAFTSNCANLSLTLPRQVTHAGSTALRQRLHRAFRDQDSESQLEIEGAILRLLLSDSEQWDALRADSPLVVANSRNAA
jgi:hypothetical protein